MFTLKCPWKKRKNISTLHTVYYKKIECACAVKTPRHTTTLRWLSHQNKFPSSSFAVAVVFLSDPRTPQLLHLLYECQNCIYPMLNWDTVRLHSRAWVGGHMQDLPLKMGECRRIGLFTLLSVSVLHVDHILKLKY